MTGEGPRTRAELERPYRQPYRVWLPRSWRARDVPVRLTSTAVAGGGLGVMAAITDVTALAYLGALTFGGALADWAYGSAIAARAVRRHTREWDQPSELERVRARRPHAGERDPELVHEEFAVTVEESGELLIWCFRPLAVDEATVGREVLVPGRPSHGATVVERHPFDHDDAAAAATELADAQTRAAAHEQLAREDARRALERHQEALLVAEETASTAAALRHLTGQSRSR